VGFRRAVSTAIRYHLTTCRPDKLDFTGQFQIGPSKQCSARSTLLLAAVTNDH
jgi:hypothetical protein